MLYQIILIQCCLLYGVIGRGVFVREPTDTTYIVYEEYCPKMHNCIDGAHVMCMYYNPYVQSYKCADYQNVSISVDIAKKLLDIANEIRGRISQGIETGKDNTSLPRGYGMFKLQWDNELATFAQVLADTCELKHDLCRATKLFEQPGQLMSAVRFTVDDWFPVSHLKQFTRRGFTADKAEYAAKEALKTWYMQKQLVTAELIKKAPDYQNSLVNNMEKMYLQLIDGQTTHMGCGISAYGDYSYAGQKVKDVLFNVVQVVCNFSTQPKKDTIVYKMENPYPLPFSHYFSKCGCPEETKEDDRCLCIYNPMTYLEENTPRCDGEACKPAVVLLPIFTVDDVPKDGLKRHGSNSGINKAIFGGQTNPEWTQKGAMDLEVARRGRYQNTNQKAIASELRIGLDPNGESHGYSINTINSPFYGKNVPMSGPPFQQIKNVSPPEESLRKFEVQPFNPRLNIENIFSKPPRFNPVLKQQNSPNYNFINNHIENTKKMDVAPRKDFSKARQLVDSYLSSQNKKPHFGTSKFVKNRKPLAPRVKNYSLDSTFRNSITPNKTVSHVTEHYPISEPYHEPNVEDVYNLNEEFDTKLMTLLDTLEQEVRHIELGDNEKEIFDAKIRKIYGSVVGKPAGLFSSFSRGKINDGHEPDNEGEESFLLDALEDPNKKLIDKEMFETENKVREINSEENDSYLEAKQEYHRPLPRDQNSLTPYEDLDPDHYDFRNTFRNSEEFKHKYPNKKRIFNNNFRNDHDFKRPKFNRYRGSKDIKEHPLLKAITKHTEPMERHLYRNHMGEKHERIRPRFPARGLNYRNRLYNNEKTVRHEDKMGRHPRIDEMRNKIDDPKSLDYDVRHVEGMKGRNYYLDNTKIDDYDDENDALSQDRKKYYQEKLDDLGRKLQGRHSINKISSNDHDTVRTRRLMTGQEFREFARRNRPSRPNPPRYYIPDRPRISRGY